MVWACAGNGVLFLSFDLAAAAGLGGAGGGWQGSDRACVLAFGPDWPMWLDWPMWVQLAHVGLAHVDLTGPRGFDWPMCV